MTTYIINKPIRESGVYKIVHSPSGKVYVGSAVNIDRRWREHKYQLENGRHRNQKLQRAWAKHGAKEFSFQVIEFCEKENLLAVEQGHMDMLDSVTNGYNIVPTAGSNLGFKHSAETIAKISEANTGKEHPEEVKARMRGRIVSEETRLALSESHTGNTPSDATRAKMSESRKRRPPHSQKTRDAISKSKTGKPRPPVTEATREKLRQAQARLRAERQE